MSSKIAIELPKVKARWAEKYELVDLKKEFSIPDFQRKANATHINGMVDAIRNNKFYNIVICYFVDSKGKKQILDGQQRLEALSICHEKYGLQHYNLMFLIFEEKFARTVFRRLNMGKVLTTRDHSKALDDGSSNFFNELRPWFGHERTPNKATYVELLNALRYQKTQNVATVKIKDLDTTIYAITDEDLKNMKVFSEACRKVSPVVFGSEIYKPIIYRNCFRISTDEKLKTDQIVKLLVLCKTNHKLNAESIHRNQYDMLLFYKIITTEILPKVTN
jgi:hypothetical protein